MIERGVTPLVPFPGSGLPWLSRCQVCGEEVSPRYGTVVVAGKGGCNPCAKREAGLTRLKRQREKAERTLGDAGLKPLSDYEGMHFPWTVECNACGNVWTAMAASLVRHHGCPKCSSIERGEKLRNRNADSAMRMMIAAGVRPLEAYPGAHVPWLCQCETCGALVRPMASSVQSGQGGCKPCGANRGATARRMNSDLALDVMLAAKISPIDPQGYKSKNTPWPGICMTCGDQVAPMIGNILQGHSGCRRCSLISVDSSFDFLGEAIVYLIKHESLNAGKVGIAGSNMNRLSAHTGQGWQTVSVMNLDHGFDAWYLEGAVLAWLRNDLKVKSFVAAHQMPQGGHTETFSLNAVSTELVWERVQQIWATHEWTAPAVLEGKSSKKARRACSLANSEVACDQPYSSNGYCRRHLRAFQLYGDPLHVQRERFDNEFCQVVEDGLTCGKPASRKGMCSVHYYRNYMYGDPLTLLRPTPQTLPEKCTIEACSSAPYSLGLCKRHYGAHRRSLTVRDNR